MGYNYNECTVWYIAWVHAHPCTVYGYSSHVYSLLQLAVTSLVIASYVPTVITFTHHINTGMNHYRSDVSEVLYYHVCINVENRYKSLVVRISMLEYI